jgi:CRISPR/Cas system CSM-associated protein Csm2 small subunit
MTKSNNYIVGRGRPPVHARFAKGKSGNPKGRPRKTATLPDKVAKILAKTQSVNVGGQKVSLTLEDLFLTSIIQNAIRCKNAKSMMMTLEWIRDLDLARAKERQTAKSRDSRITSEMLSKMTDQERTDLYFETLRQVDGRSRLEDDDA